MNPGSDQGELINTAFAAFIPDVIDFMEMQYNGPWHNFCDKIVIKQLNSVLPCYDNDEDDN